MDKDPFNLRHLPQRPAPDELWRAIEARLHSSDSTQPGRRRRRMPGIGVAGVAMAAALAAAIALVVVMGTPPDREPAASDASTFTLGLVDARRLSAELETRLAESRGGVLKPEDVAELVWIESELRLTDELLASRPGNAELWTRRVQLLDEMDRRYRTRDWQARLQRTSY